MATARAVAAKAMLKWGSGSHVEGRRPENRGAEGAEGGGCDLQMVCFGVFCSAKFTFWLPQKAVKIIH